MRLDDLLLQTKRLQDTRRNQIRQLRNRLSESEEDRAPKDWALALIQKLAAMRLMRIAMHCVRRWKVQTCTASSVP